MDGLADLDSALKDCTETDCTDPATDAIDICEERECAEDSGIDDVRYCTGRRGLVGKDTMRSSSSEPSFVAVYSDDSLGDLIILYGI